MKIIETNLRFGSLLKRSRTNRIILHHAAATRCDAKTIHKWHINKGWSGIGYHFVVRKNGTIERGRPENTIGAHATGNNSDSIGICFEGNFENETMSDAQIKAGRELITFLKKKYGISKVQKHRDVGQTACPGKYFPFTEIVSTSDKTNDKMYNVPFLVKVKVSDLTIREGAGTNTKAKGHITDSGTYTITEVKYNGSTPWGRLKSGAGWISLLNAYVKTV